MKRLFAIYPLLSLPLAAALTLTEIPTFPATNALENTGGSVGSSVLASGNSKGQTFDFAGDAHLSGIALQIDSATTASDLTLEIYATSGNTPTGSALYSDSGTLPATLAGGDILQIEFSAQQDLSAGSYAIVLETTGSNLAYRLNNSNDYSDGQLIRKNSGSGGNWATGGNSASDFIFGLLGTIDPEDTGGGGETPTRPTAAIGKPNIIFILADDLGWTDHNVAIMAKDYESDFYQTPNLARLASEGVSFTSAYAQPNCAPTRAALMTGQYSARTGNGVYNVDSLSRASGRTTYTTPASQGSNDYINGDEATVTIAESFYNSGYVTAHFGKYHVGSSTASADTHPLNQGFDYNYGGNTNGNPGDYFANSGIFGSKVGPELDPFAANYDSAYITANLTPYANGNTPGTVDGQNKHITDAMGDAFVSFMNGHFSGAMADYPVYAQVHFYAVHTPIQSRSDLKNKYAALPDGTTHGNNAYAGLLENMDHSVGRILDYLKTTPSTDPDYDFLIENTLLIFTSDNGGHMEGGITSNVPLRGRKGMHYEGGIRVPLVIRAPNNASNAGKVSDTLIHCVDYYPTMLDFADGISPDSETHPLDGVSLHDHILDPDNTVRNRAPIYYHFPGYMDSRAYACSMIIQDIDNKRYKYIYAYDPYYNPGNDSSTGHTTQGFDQYQLYCLTDDISESTNLLDYIDIENASDSNDPSSSEEYWNYILNKDLATTLATNLNTWLLGDSEDDTWQPVHVKYKSNFPNIDSALIGEPAAPAPAVIPEVSTTQSDSFHVAASALSDSDNVSLTFPSEPGFTYQVQATSTLGNDSWGNVGDSVTPTSGSSTTHVIADPAAASATERFYRVAVSE